MRGFPQSSSTPKKEKTVDKPRDGQPVGDLSVNPLDFVTSAKEVHNLSSNLADLTLADEESLSSDEEIQGGIDSLGSVVDPSTKTIYNRLELLAKGEFAEGKFFSLEAFFYQLFTFR